MCKVLPCFSYAAPPYILMTSTVSHIDMKSSATCLASSRVGVITNACKLYKHIYSSSVHVCLFDGKHPQNENKIGLSLASFWGVFHSKVA